jgi:hypothetical protein
MKLEAQAGKEANQILQKLSAASDAVYNSESPVSWEASLNGAAG